MGELLVSAGCDHLIITDFFDLIRAYWTPNFCQYNHKFFVFSEEVGIPIGSPLGSLIGEVFMNALENQMFSSRHPLLTHITYWHRYVDDVLCLWEGPLPLADSFLEFVNSLFPSITFTMEVGGMGINFLDLTIQIINGAHTFRIYRKSSSSDSTINGSSFCPWPQKLAAFNSYVHRLVSIPMGRQDFDREVEILEHLANVNHINIDVKNMIMRKSVRVQLDCTTSLPRTLNLRRRERWIRHPHLGKVSHEIGRILRPFGFRPVFYNLRTFKHFLPSLKDEIPPDEKSGVYRIECGDCPGVYIGETGRKMITRVNEHLSAWFSFSFGKSAFSDHLLISGHAYKGGSARLLRQEKSSRKRLALEEIYIHRHRALSDSVLLNTHIPENDLITSIYAVESEND